MTKIKFTVTGQQLKRLTMPYLVRDSKRHIQLDFAFMTKGWSDCIKTVVFKTCDGIEASKQLGEKNTMRLPTKIAAAESFKVSVFGVNLTEDIRITTNPVEIILGESGYSEVGEIEEPLPSVYEQILDTCTNAVEVAEDVKKRADAGEFNGKDGKNGIDGKDGNNGKDGKDYVLTEADKVEIAGMVKLKLEIAEYNIDDVEASVRVYTNNVMTIEANLPENARVKKIELLDESNGINEYMNLEDMTNLDPIGNEVPYSFIFPKNKFGTMMPIAAHICFPLGTNDFYVRAQDYNFVGTLKIYYEIEE